MKGIIYKFSLIVAVISLVTSLLSGVSVLTGMVRSGIVFLATLVVFIIALNALRWSLMKATHPVRQTEKTGK